MKRIFCSAWASVGLLMISGLAGTEAAAHRAYAAAMANADLGGGGPPRHDVIYFNQATDLRLVTTLRDHHSTGHRPGLSPSLATIDQARAWPVLPVDRSSRLLAIGDAGARQVAPMPVGKHPDVIIGVIPSAAPQPQHVLNGPGLGRWEAKIAFVASHPGVESYGDKHPPSSEVRRSARQS